MKVENCTLSTGGENSLNILLVPGNIPRPQTYVTTENPILEVFCKYDLFRGSNNICMKIDKKGDRQSFALILLLEGMFSQSTVAADWKRAIKMIIIMVMMTTMMTLTLTLNLTTMRTLTTIMTYLIFFTHIRYAAISTCRGILDFVHNIYGEM